MSCYADPSICHPHPTTRRQAAMMCRLADSMSSLRQSKLAFRFPSNCPGKRDYTLVSCLWQTIGQGAHHQPLLLRCHARPRHDLVQRAFAANTDLVVIQRTHLIAGRSRKARTWRASGHSWHEQSGCCEKPRLCNFLQLIQIFKLPRRHSAKAPTGQSIPAKQVLTHYNTRAEQQKKNNGR